MVNEQETVAQDATKKSTHNPAPHDVDAGLSFDGATKYGESLFEIIRTKIVEASGCLGISLGSLGVQAIAPDAGSTKSEISEVEHSRE